MYCSIWSNRCQIFNRLTPDLDFEAYFEGICRRMVYVFTLAEDLYSFTAQLLMETVRPECATEISL